MRELLLTCLIVAGCATSHPTPTPVATAPVPPPPPAAAATVALVVHDPTDLTGRLATQLSAALAGVGVASHIVNDRAAARDRLIVEVQVLNRQRSVDDVKTQHEGRHLPTRIGLVGAGEEPTKPDQHGREQFNSGKTSEESDLRLIVSATLSRANDAEPIARWDDVEGTLIPRASDGTQPVLHPWQALYGALSDRLAEQIRAAIPR